MCNFCVLLASNALKSDDEICRVFRGWCGAAQPYGALATKMASQSQGGTLGQLILFASSSTDSIESIDMNFVRESECERYFILL